jgi:hypothetical protein
METLKPLVDQLIEMIKQGKDVIGGQLPDVANQILAYYAYFDRTWLWVLGVAFILCAVVFFLGTFLGNDAEILAPVGFFGMGLSGLFFVIAWLDLAKIQLAPKVYLLEFLKGFLK